MMRKLIAFAADINNPSPFWSSRLVLVPTCVSSKMQCSWCSTNLAPDDFYARTKCRKELVSTTEIYKVLVKLTINLNSSDRPKPRKITSKQKRICTEVGDITQVKIKYDNHRKRQKQDREAGNYEERSAASNSCKLKSASAKCR